MGDRLTEEQLEGLDIAAASGDLGGDRERDEIHALTAEVRDGRVLIAKLRAALAEAINLYDEKPGGDEWSGCLCPSLCHLDDCQRTRIAALCDVIKETRDG